MAQPRLRVGSCVRTVGAFSRAMPAETGRVVSVVPGPRVPPFGEAYDELIVEFPRSGFKQTYARGELRRVSCRGPTAP